MSADPSGLLPPPVPPDGDTPIYRRLIGAHDRYMRALSSLVGVRLSPGASIGQWVPLALYHHVFQLGRALQTVLEVGYSEEALPVCRAMISTAMNLLFIVTSDNSEGWSLRYMLQVTEVEERMLDQEIHRQRFDGATLTALRQATRDTAEYAIAAFKAEGGMYPDKLRSSSGGRPRRDTWTGLSDADLAKHISLGEWKETEYDFLSTIAHAQAVAILPTRDTLFAGHPLILGPHFRSPLPAITSSVNALRYASLAAMKHFNRTDVDAQFQVTNDTMSAAIVRYREESGGNAMVTSIFGERQA